MLLVLLVVLSSHIFHTLIQLLLPIHLVNIFNILLRICLKEEIVRVGFTELVKVYPANCQCEQEKINVGGQVDHPVGHPASHLEEKDLGKQGHWE